MIIPGSYHTLTASRESDFGMFLKDEKGEEVLLPKRYLSDDFKVDDEIEVFVYTDSEDRLVATTLKPLVSNGTFAMLKVKDVTPHGAFLEWGLEGKDLFVPYRNQRDKMKVGEYHLVTTYADNLSDRVVGTSKIGAFISNHELTVEEGQHVNILICEPRERGFRVLIEDKHWGMIYSSEIFKDINMGDRMEGFIVKIRPDNKIDVSIRQSASKEVSGTEGKILQALNDNDGFLPLHDKSSPDEIYSSLGISKKVFKKAIGGLYKAKKISMEKNGIRIL